MGPEALGAVEALLFASDAPLELERIQEVLEVGREEALAVVGALMAQYEAPGRGLAIVEVAGGYRICTRPELAPWLLKLRRAQARVRLSRAALETLAIIAYRQPIARPEIEQLRGVNAEGVLAHLLERRLIRVVGRKETPGRPLLYGTTREFLLHFGLRDLSELPPFEAPAETPGAPPSAPAPEPVAPSPDDGQPEG